MFNAQPFPHLPKDLIADSTVQFVGGVYIGESCEFGENTIVDGSNYRIAINSNCKIGKNTKIFAETEKIEIGSGVVIGDNCLITDSIEENSVIENNQSVLYKHI